MRAIVALIAGTCGRAAVSAAMAASIITVASGFGRELMVTAVTGVMWAGVAILCFGVIAGIGAAAGVIETTTQKGGTDV